MDWELILEAERRGILPPDKAELLAEGYENAVFYLTVKGCKRIAEELASQQEET